MTDEIRISPLVDPDGNQIAYIKPTQPVEWPDMREVITHSSVHRIGPRWWQLWRRFQAWRFRRTWTVAEGECGGRLSYTPREVDDPEQVTDQ